MLRLTQEQKFFHVSFVLLNAVMPMTRRQIGRQIGFVNGNPVKPVVDELLKLGYLHVTSTTLMDKTVEYFWMPFEARMKAWETFPEFEIYAKNLGLRTEE